MRDLATPKEAAESGVNEFAAAVLKRLRDSGVNPQVS